jgi:hypothetical protein
MTWTEVKQLVRQSGLKHSTLNKGGACAMVHVEKHEGGFITDAFLFAYEPHYWEARLLRVGIAVPKQMELFGVVETKRTNAPTRS